MGMICSSSHLFISPCLFIFLILTLSMYFYPLLIMLLLKNVNHSLLVIMVFFEETYIHNIVVYEYGN